jgi:NTE family protein
MRDPAPVPATGPPRARKRRPPRPGRRIALALSGGGARGAYEAGVLAYLFENVYPELPRTFEFDIVSGTSVGAIHAAWVAATARLHGRERSKALVDTWRGMRLRDVLQVRPGDLVGVPLRALGLRRLARTIGREGPVDAVGGLVDLTPLEQIVENRIPWAALRANLARRRPGVLCISCTEVRSGLNTLFLDGVLADPAPWANDPGARAVVSEISAAHVRASAAIPFLFPAVRVKDHLYVDGGLRMNTPLSPALRLGADRVIVVALKNRPRTPAGPTEYPEEAITQPAFLLGKVLNALLLDQLESELHRMDLVNAWIARGEEVYGPEFLERMNVALRARRGTSYRYVESAVVRPSEDLGSIAARAWRRGGGRELGALGAIFARFALRGVPAEEADLLSYLYFDAAYTSELVDLGYEDARRHRAELIETIVGDGPTPA